jgi:ABC-type sugar transport system permease subunit
MEKRFFEFRFVIMVVLTIVTAFLFPFLLSAFSNVSIENYFTNNSLGLDVALFRTCLFSLVSSFINLIISLQLAILIRHISIDSKTGHFLSFLLLPVILGNVTVSYIFKCSLYGTSLFDNFIENGGLLQQFLLFFIQFWQYGFLFTYLFWLDIRQIPEKKLYYAFSVKMTEREIVRDIILPYVKTLFILLFIISFVFAFFESAKCQFIFKTSQGTNTEFISQALYRIYQSYSIADPNLARSITLKIGLLITLCVLFLISICSSFLYITFHVFRKTTPVFLVSEKVNGEIIAKFCIVIVLIPIIFSLLKSDYSFLSKDILSLIIPLFLTFLSALFASAVAIVFGIATRCVFYKELNRLSLKPLFIFLLIFLLEMTPPVCVVICGYIWMSLSGYNEIVTYFIWIWGHPILIFPILGSFILATHFAIKNNEIEWSIIHKLKSCDIIKYSFWGRFRIDYSLTYLFAFTFIWNDVTLNKILSDEIPSFAEKMQRLFIGRAANDAQATLYVLISIVIALSCLHLWNIIVKRNYIEK